MTKTIVIFVYIITKPMIRPHDGNLIVWVFFLQVCGNGGGSSCNLLRARIKTTQPTGKAAIG